MVELPDIDDPDTSGVPISPSATAENHSLISSALKKEAIHVVNLFESYLYQAIISVYVLLGPSNLTIESWVTSGLHKQCYVTGKAGEKLDETCLRISPPRKRGCMFWGSIHASFKGSCLLGIY